MAYASRLGRARINASSPESAGQCDRCSAVVSFRDMLWQRDWRGATLQNIRLLVCQRCLDTPQPQLRSITLPPDPTPIINARTVDWSQAESNYQTITQPSTIDPITGIPIPGTTTLVTEDGRNLLTQSTGAPLGYDQNAVMPLEGTTHYRVKLEPLSVSASGTDQVRVTFGAVHGLSTNAQIVVQGLSNREADGAYSITVISATAFTYQINNELQATSLLTPTTLMVTADIGLPYGFEQLPQTGGSGINGRAGPITDNGILTETSGFLLQENGYFLLQG